MNNTRKHKLTTHINTSAQHAQAHVNNTTSTNKFSCFLFDISVVLTTSAWS